MSSGMLSKLWVSSAPEATAGTPTTINKRLLFTSCDFKLMTNDEKRDEITGFFNALDVDRQEVTAGGSLDCWAKPDTLAWMFRMLFGNPATSGLVSPSSTVYEHTWDSFVSTPKTFSLFKQISDISGFTERYAGNGLTDMSIKSGKGKISVSAKIEGMGKLTTGLSSPVQDPIFTSDDAPFIGTNSSLLIDDVSVSAGTDDFDTDWSIDIGTGAGNLSTGGSTDNTVNRFDLLSEHTIRAQFTLYTTDADMLADYIADQYHTYEFQMSGRLIDVPNSLRQLCTIKLMKAKMINEFKSEMTDKGVFKIPIQLEAVVDHATGAELEVAVRNLVSAYA